MGIINFKRENNKTVKESGFKIGDIIVGTTHWYRTETYWYEIIGMTEKQLKLKQLNVCYPTEYMSNTSGSQCMPVLEFVNEKLGIRKYFPADGFPYWNKYNEGVTFKASISLFITTEETKGKMSIKNKEYKATIIGEGEDYPRFSLWDGKPGWVNCGD